MRLHHLSLSAFASTVFPLFLTASILSCGMLALAKADRATLSQLLGTAVPAELDETPRLLRCAVLLAEQVRGIDYKSLGLGWHHPTERTAYRARQHKSFSDRSSRKRSDESLQALAKLIGSPDGVSEKVLVEVFTREIGVSVNSWISADATFEASLHSTFNGEPLPPDRIERSIGEVTQHVLKGDFSEWRYSNPVGLRQLEGLSVKQQALWAEPSRTERDGLVIHEDGPGELGFFWATKIGGPSHGFDLEGQCLLPLLANARHKVVLVSDPAWPAHPCGRAHFRLLWSIPAKADGPQAPRLWLETVNADFAASGVVNSWKWESAVLVHVLQKAAAMGVPLSVCPGLAEDVKASARSMGLSGSGSVVRERIVLRPSNGVVEASDYLGDRHDWLQIREEVISSISRFVFTASPSSPEHTQEL